MIGRDPNDSAIVPHPNGLSHSHDAAVAGIDATLWDLKGKMAGKRVCELLADRQPPERVRLYASDGCSYDWGQNPEQLIEEALRYIDQSFTAFKFRIQFVISDNGPQFICGELHRQVFAALSQEAGFVHVRIAPHRLCTNGIAERFVRTLKEWLDTHAWRDATDMEQLTT